MNELDALTVADVARAAGVTPSTVRAYVARGQMPMPSGQLGRTPYWTREAITPWIAVRQARQAAAPDLTPTA